jgi:hypothetical protein
VVKILRKFSMNNVKLVKSLWLSIVNYLQVYVLIDEEEKGYMSRVLYASRKFDDCDGEMINISHAVGGVDRHMEKPGQEHGNGCFKHRSTSITYSGCSDLVCGYDS